MIKVEAELLNESVYTPSFNTLVVVVVKKIYFIVTAIPFKASIFLNINKCPSA
jgi:hypothetical protein